MAQQMVCDGCGKEPAVLLLTNISNGDVQAVGANCLPTWLRAMADTVEAAPGSEDEPVPYTVTDSASPQYDPDTGKLLDNPATPAPAPPQPTTDTDSRGTGDGTYDHGAVPETVPGSAPETPAVPDGGEQGGQTPPAPESSPANPEADPGPVPDNAPGALVGV